MPQTTLDFDWENGGKPPFTPEKKEEKQDGGHYITPQALASLDPEDIVDIVATGYNLDPSLLVSVPQYIVYKPKHIQERVRWVRNPYNYNKEKVVDKEEKSAKVTFTVAYYGTLTPDEKQALHATTMLFSKRPGYTITGRVYASGYKVRDPDEKKSAPFYNFSKDLRDRIMDRYEAKTENSDNPTV